MSEEVGSIHGGGARSRLSVRYRDPFSSTGVWRSKEIFAGESPTSLDDVTRAVARWADVEADVSESFDY